MKIRNCLAGGVMAGVLMLAAGVAHAALICSACEYGGGAGTYLGAYNPADVDFGTFQHSDVGQDAGAHAPFEDFWVFDLGSDANGSISADFTMFAAISGFAGELYRDAGSACAGDECSSIMLGDLVANGLDTERRWEVMATGLTAGRYVVRVTGITNGNLTSATDRKSQTTTQSYDALNRPLTRAFADTSTLAYTWDAGNRLTQAVDSISGTITRTYHPLDGVLTEADGYAEREVALELMRDRRGTLGADRGYDAEAFVGTLRAKCCDSHAWPPASMLTAKPPASRRSSCICACREIEMPTSGGSRDSETSALTVWPSRCPSTATVTTATPLGKRRMTSRRSSPSTTGRS